MTDQYKSLESKIREVQRQALMKRMEEAAIRKGRVTAQVVQPEVKKLDEEDCRSSIVSKGPKDGPSPGSRGAKRIAAERAAKEEKKEEVEVVETPAPEEVKLDPIEELAPTQNPLQQKLAAQKAQLQKQKEQIRLQIAQQKAAKQEQIMKQKGEKELQKVKEEEEIEEAGQRYQVRTFRSASRLQQLHQSRIQQLARQNDPRARRLIALHRQRAMELKRIAYGASDNPEKLPVK